MRIGHKELYKYSKLGKLEIHNVLMRNKKKQYRKAHARILDSVRDEFLYPITIKNCLMGINYLIHLGAKDMRVIKTNHE